MPTTVPNSPQPPSTPPLSARLAALLIALIAAVAPVSAQQDAECRFPADLADRLLQGGVDLGDLPVTANFVVDEQILLDEGRVEATVEGGFESGPLELMERARICVFLLLDVDGEPILSHRKQLDLDDFRSVESVRYVLRADLPEGTRHMTWVVSEAKTGMWGAQPMQEPGGAAIKGPSFTAVRVEEYEGAYYEIRRRQGAPPSRSASAGTGTTAGSGAGASPSKDSDTPIELFPRTIQTPRLGSVRRPREAPEKLAGEQILRLVPPRRQPQTGSTVFHVLTSTVAVERVVLEVDGQRVDEDTRAPFRLRASLASPAREQTVRAIGYDELGVVMADDTVRVNQLDAPFRVRFTEFSGEPSGGRITVAGEASIPVDGRLDRLELWYNEELIETARDATTLRREMEIAEVTPTDYIRLAAYLSDGASIDDVILLAAPEVEEVDVNLVEVHAVVTGRDGKPVTDLEGSDFTIVAGGEERPAASFAYADDVPLVMGLLVDTSGSMELLMHDTRRAATKFIGQTVRSSDQAFLVDFDEQPRLLHDVTGDVVGLMRSLSRLEAAGRTAMFDAVVFSLLQFEGRTGRRALVVLTDGDDIESRFGPKQCAEMARTSGVPVYVIGLGSLDTLRRTLPKSDLRHLTEKTGGRLFFVDTFEQLADAYAQINAELRGQYSLSFYADGDLTDEERDEIEVRVPRGLEARSVVGPGSLNP
ncbi:MAG: VWA domain-containing protein [Acidobacteriota bacterium]